MALLKDKKFKQPIELQQEQANNHDQIITIKHLKKTLSQLNAQGFTKEALGDSRVQIAIQTTLNFLEKRQK